jgi:hypothetical protein
VSAATDFRMVRLSRETRDWIAGGRAFIDQIASDFAADLDADRLQDLSFALSTVVDEWDVAPQTERASE